MDLSRRRLFAAAAVLLALPVLDWAARLVAGTRGAVSAIRPTANGTSATRCALCGAADHAMLDPRCPAARPVL